MLLSIFALAAHVHGAEPILWENVPAGLPVADVRALYPARAEVRHAADRITISGHRVSPDCGADVHIMHGGGAVSGVLLRGDPSIAGLCGASVLELLTARHGQPLSAETRRPSLFKRTRTTYMWNLGGIYLHYVRYAAGSGMSALADANNPSWEMSYSTGRELLRP